MHLAKLNVPGYELASEKVTKQGIAGTKFHVYVHDPGTQHRRLCDIETILRGSALASHIQDRAMEVFTRLAEAEATVHQTAIHQVHFHEVGAIDSIVDITGTASICSAYNAFSPRRSMSAADSCGPPMACSPFPVRQRPSSEGGPNLCTGVRMES